MEIGDVVSDEFVEDMMSCVPPVYYGKNFAQCGEPHGCRIDEVTGKARETYAAFKRNRDGKWEFCGNCFSKENVERGKTIPVVRS